MNKQDLLDYFKYLKPLMRERPKYYTESFSPSKYNVLHQDVFKELLPELLEKKLITPQDKYNDSNKISGDYILSPQLIKMIDPDFDEIIKLSKEFSTLREQDYKDRITKISNLLQEKGYTLPNGFTELAKAQLPINRVGQRLQDYIVELNSGDSEILDSLGIDELLNTLGISKSDYYNLDNQDTIPSKNYAYLSPTMFKNLIKSGNRDKSIRELNDFILDNAYRFAENEQFDSLNSIRNAIKNYQEQDRLAAELQVIKDYLHSKGWEWDERNKVIWQHGINGEVVPFDSPKFEQLKQEALADINRPYDYSEDIKGTVPEEWKLLESPEEQKCIGTRLRHCYGDIKTFGAEHFKQYSNKIKSRQTLLLNKDDVTAEIALKIDDNGVIDDAKIVQVMGPRNTPREESRELVAMAEDLIGKNINSLSPKEVEDTISDICCKYIVSPVNRNILINRRF